MAVTVLADVANSAITDLGIDLLAQDKCQRAPDRRALPSGAYRIPTEGTASEYAAGQGLWGEVVFVTLPGDDSRSRPSYRTLNGPHDRNRWAADEHELPNDDEDGEGGTCQDG